MFYLFIYLCLDHRGYLECWAHEKLSFCLSSEGCRQFVKTSSWRLSENKWRWVMSAPININFFVSVHYNNFFILQNFFWFSTLEGRRHPSLITLYENAAQPYAIFLFLFWQDNLPAAAQHIITLQTLCATLTDRKMTEIFARTCDVSLPVWPPTAACYSSRSSPALVYPGRKWRGRWCRRVTGPSAPSRTQSSWFLPPRCHNCSSPAEGARSRTESTAKCPPQPAGACGSLSPACCTRWECCSDHRRGLPERSARQSLRKQTEKMLEWAALQKIIKKDRQNYITNWRD